MSKRVNDKEQVPSSPKRTRVDDETMNVNQHVQKARSRLLARISERAIPPKLHGLERQYDQLHHLLKQTVTLGESNSCLLIGNRGTGKTMLVRSVLDDLDKMYNRDNNRSFVLVRLNGLTETSDRLALAEISRQILSEQTTGQSERSFSSFAESFAYILSLLKSGSKATLPIIFVLEEFDLFTQHPKQALLYNLFDTVQSAQNPLAVIGLTCRLDTLELLEKRVKSRFSHRQIYLFPPTVFRHFLDIAKDSLSLQVRSTDPVSYQNYVKTFNQSVNELFDDVALISLLRRIFDLTKDLRLFYKICFDPVTKLTAEEPLLQVIHFQTADMMQRTDSKTEMLKGVSLLELILIVSMKKLMERDISVFNFQMVYDEYKEFMSSTQVRGMGFGMKLYKRAVALKAFENLQAFELVCPTEQIGKRPKEFRMAKLMLEQAQVTEAVYKYKDCPATVKKWGTGSV
ncbi:origin recognition complex subunit 4 C-terminus-domain-containing protein [Radiomyces spectabilis]|uniref:origin recognition complex subunit 4 C-terminus-domain-containing protein n=1 Tax=Radiomyces spectabilis TaxID=64574 RepID=UPI002220A95E|nr:origin recognition complex subunit 4 C-terminus-domain-containing protein [Radiomyces spectabilis]KAI8377566.1 origin recognition complex subunit 4 C-terminus-domain-containing protein [Radiomyces spectabilis]